MISRTILLLTVLCIYGAGCTQVRRSNSLLLVRPVCNTSDGQVSTRPRNIGFGFSMPLCTP